MASNTITRLAKAIDIDKSFIVLSLSDQCSRRRLLFDDSAGPTDALSHASRQLSGGHVLLTFTISCETPAEVAHVQKKVANSLTDATASSDVLGCAHTPLYPRPREQPTAHERAHTPPLVHPPPSIARARARLSPHTDLTWACRKYRITILASPVLTSTQPPSPPSPPRASEELATGVIVGLAAGSACAFLILVLMIVMCIVYVRMGKARRPDVQALEGFPVATTQASWVEATSLETESKAIEA